MCVRVYVYVYKRERKRERERMREKGGCDIERILSTCTSKFTRSEERRVGKEC